ncbi:hypothetical protein, partial [Pseudomonas sp. FSL R10-2189]|uniref:hypothetical protein n=1 Tax=Pseudomonas sp. FSL R10-2189 TaxID=2662199 RepID=UPI001C49B19E
MSKAVSSIASEVNELLRKNGNEFMTLKWAQFYKICDRERLADVVMENIAKQLKKNDLHSSDGNNVIVVRDLCWSPV